MDLNKMNFIAITYLTDIVREQEKRLKTLCFLYLIGCLVGCYLMFVSNKHQMSYFLLSAYILFISVVVTLLYSTISYYGKDITLTSFEVGFFDDSIILKTFPFKVFFLFNRPSKELKFKISETRIKKKSYPLKGIYDLDRTIQLIYQGKAIYIIFDYFDMELEKKILEIYF